MTKIPKVSIIVTNYNGGQILIDCIESLKKIDYSNFEVVLVDNRSVDGSFEKAISKKGNLNLISYKNKVDLGFTGANNKGFELSSGDYILLLNNDTKVDRNLLKILVKKMESDPKIGAAQVKIKMMDVPNHLDNAGSFLTRTGFLVHWGFGKKDSKEFDKETIIFSAKGACLITRREIINKVGLFDSDFVSYIEETDFCWRVWLAGYKIYFFPQTYIWHKVGYTFSKQFNPVVVNYNSFKNRILCLYKNLETKNIFLILVPHLFIIIGLSVFYLSRLQFSKFSMIMKALWWNIKNFDESSKKRRIVQDMRVRSDDEIFKYIMKKFKVKEMFSHFLKVEANFTAKRTI
jgi:hypothetical protein